MPDLIKIGKTTNLEDRLRNLSSQTGVPVPFQCYYACEVEDCSDVEMRLHKGFGDHRINIRREFFRINPERVRIILEGWEINNVTPKQDIAEDNEELVALENETRRRPVFRFSMVEIQIGTKLQFIKDNEIVATVADDRKVEYDGEKYSLSKLATKILKERLNIDRPVIRGPDYWMYKNKTLSELRIRFEDQGDQED